MKDWSISTRLGAAFALLLLLLLGLAGAAYRQMGHLHDSSRDLSDSWLPSVAAVAQVKAQAIQTRVFIARHILPTPRRLPNSTKACATRAAPSKPSASSTRR